MRDKRIKDRRKYFRNKADALWQKIIQNLYPDCFCCGQPTDVGHHYIPKKQSNSLRYRLINGVGLCRRCHNALHNTQDPFVYATITAKMRLERLAKIRKIREQIVNTNITFYKNNIERLKKIYGNSQKARNRRPK